MKKIRILYKPIGRKPKEMYIENTLEAKQKLVSGLIECVNYDNDKVLICNEEGKVNGLYPNIVIPGDIINGNLFITGDDYENADFKSLTQEQIENIKRDLINQSIHYTPTQMKSVLQQEQMINKEFKQQEIKELEEFYKDMEKDLIKDPNDKDLDYIEKDFNSNIKSKNGGDENEKTL